MYEYAFFVSCNTLYVDGLFMCSAKYFTQLLRSILPTILIIFSWFFLLPDKKQGTYETAFSSVSTLVTDFEVAINQAAKTVFPHTELWV